VRLTRPAQVGLTSVSQAQIRRSITALA
jgi:hypothetical protein